MELAECSLGLPQFVVVCDTKNSEAENKLSLFTTLFSLEYATAGFDTGRLYINLNAY